MSEANVRFGFAAYGFVCGAAAALFLSALLSRPVQFRQESLPAGLYDTKEWVGYTVRRGDILLRFVSREEFDKEDGRRGSGAFTKTQGRPCEIWVPEGWTMHFQPYSNNTVWDDRWYGNALGHEILHCMVPDWHEGFTERRAIAMKSR